MHLKSLVLKGFKSFADRSVMTFEPGITVIVGPNGSGKSNISDSVLWVLGERNARNLRGQAMEDVIFSGSAARKASGMAEVDLVLDNTDNTLPVEFSEVVLSRRMYRSGTMMITAMPMVYSTEVTVRTTWTKPSSSPIRYIYTTSTRFSSRSITPAHRGMRRWAGQSPSVSGISRCHQGAFTPRSLRWAWRPSMRILRCSSCRSVISAKYWAQSMVMTG